MPRYDAMMRAVDMARTGKFSNWWVIWARLRIEHCTDYAVEWTERQHQWLDSLCNEARNHQRSRSQSGGVAQD